MPTKNDSRSVLGFWVIIGLLIGTRLLDNYITYLVDPHLHHEANFFVKLQGFGWTGMLLGQAVLLGLVILACALDFFGGDEIYPRLPNLMFADFVSYYHTGRPGRWFDVLWKLPHRREIIWRSLGYVLSRAWIGISVLVSISNLAKHHSQSYQSCYRVIYPYVFPLGIFVLLLTISIWAFYRKEYRRYSDLMQMGVLSASVD